MTKAQERIITALREGYTLRGPLGYSRSNYDLRDREGRLEREVRAATLQPLLNAGIIGADLKLTGKGVG